MSKLVSPTLLFFLLLLPTTFSLYTDNYNFALTILNIPPEFNNMYTQVKDFSMEITDLGKIKTAVSFSIEDLNPGGVFDGPTPNVMLLPLGKEIDFEGLKIFTAGKEVNYFISQYTLMQFLNPGEDNSVSETKKIFDNEGIKVISWQLEFGITYSIEFEVDPSLNIQAKEKFNPQFGIMFPSQGIEFNNINVLINDVFVNDNSAVELVKINQTLDLGKTTDEKEVLRFVGENNLNLEDKTRKKSSIYKESLFIFDFNFAKKEESLFSKFKNRIISVNEFINAIQGIIMIIILGSIIFFNIKKKGITEVNKKVKKKLEEDIGFER